MSAGALLGSQAASPDARCLRAHHPVAAALVLALLAISDVASAQPTTDATAADALFEEGRRLMIERRFAEACPKLADSQRLEPGIGVLLFLGECNVQVGKTASAWTAFREAAAMANRVQDPRERVALDRAAQVERRLCRVRIVVSPERRAPGLVVRRDGMAVAESLWGTESAVDPGMHTFAASAPGKKPWSKGLDAPREGGHIAVEIPALEDVVAARVEPLASSTEPSKPLAAESGRSQRLVGVALAGGGVVGIGLGAVFGIRALALRNAIEPYCSGRDCTTPQKAAERDDARSAAAISTGAFVAGGVLLVGGAVLYLTAPTAPTAPTVSVTPIRGGSGLAFDATF